MWERRKLLGRDFARRWHHRGERPGDGDPRPRVLIEEPDVAEAFAYWCLLENNGYEVSWCPGPKGPPPRRCPLVDSGQCELVHCADVVVSSLELRHESSRKVVSALRYLHPETPVIIQAPQQVMAQWAPVFEERWGAMRMPVTRQTLLDSVGTALARSAEGGNEDLDVPSCSAPTRIRPQGRGSRGCPVPGGATPATAGSASLGDGGAMVFDVLRAGRQCAGPS